MRELVVVLRGEHGLSERRACAAVNLRRSVMLSLPADRDGELVELLLQLAHQRSEEDFPSYLSDCADRAGVGITKRVHRVYCSLKLNKRRKGKRRVGG